jgi:hypothetical protein
MTDTDTKVFDLQILRSKSGLWVVETNDGKQFYMAHRDLGAIINDLPNVMRHTLQQHLVDGEASR